MASPVYIGLRVIRYGPVVTSAETARCGTIVVWCRPAQFAAWLTDAWTRLLLA